MRTRLDSRSPPTRGQASREFCLLGEDRTIPTSKSCPRESLSSRRQGRGSSRIGIISMSADNQKNAYYLQSHRIAIIGNCGSGKTAFSKQLNTFFNLPVYHLDDLFWETDWTPTESAAWKHKMNILVSKDKWIIDGTFEGTLPLRLARADLTIFLDIPLWHCLWRVIVRDIKNAIQVNGTPYP